MTSYDITNLQILTPQEHIRLRKSMYIGETNNPSPLFNEILDNALDEAQAGYSKMTEIVVDYDNNCYAVTDHGRGFPQGKLVDPSTQKEVEAVELLCTTSFSGGKFSTANYRLSSGLNGLGLLVTNSLSEKFEVETWRGMDAINYKAEKGQTKSLIYHDTESDKNYDSYNGSYVSFVPDPDMFEDPKVPLTHILMRCKIASAFGMKVNLTIIENGDAHKEDVSSTIYDLLPPDDDGISEYYRHDFIVKDPDTGEFAAIALKYTSDTRMFSRGYTNLLYNSNGGTHLKMFENALYDSWSKYKIPDINPNDVYLGVRAVVAVFISDTEFSSQSKERLSVPRQKLDKLKDLIVKEIQQWLDSNDDIRNSLIKRFQEYRSSQNKLLARKEIKSLLWINNSKDGSVRRASQVHKLRDCDARSRTGTELFIVEGDSACGSAVQAREQRSQAILPVRGKVFNVARCTNPKDALVNEETRAIINVIGAGITEDADPQKSRYEKIIFMTDADSDGKEIAVLLAGMFINLLPELVKSGMVYLALPPLYGWEDKSGFHFTNSQSEIPEKILKSENYHRYKGLGEMDAAELKVSTMDPTTRRLIQLQYPDDINAFNGILTSSGVKYKMLEDQGVIKYG